MMKIVASPEMWRIFSEKIALTILRKNGVTEEKPFGSFQVICKPQGSPEGRLVAEWSRTQKEFGLDRKG